MTWAFVRRHFGWNSSTNTALDRQGGGNRHETAGAAARESGVALQVVFSGVGGLAVRVIGAANKRLVSRQPTPDAVAVAALQTLLRRLALVLPLAVLNLTQRRLSTRSRSHCHGVVVVLQPPALARPPPRRLLALLTATAPASRTAQPSSASTRHRAPRPRMRRRWRR